MKRKEIPLLPLFERFISETKSGKRLKKNGEKIKQETINNYTYVYANLKEFIGFSSFKFRLIPWEYLDERERVTERNHWRKFYHQFSGYLYQKKNCHDNYVGAIMKILRAFFNYLNNEKMIVTGNYYRDFYITKEETKIITLSTSQLKFLINNQQFRNSLPPRLHTTLDIFIVGCTVALRFSDLFNVQSSDIYSEFDKVYLTNRSLKTQTDTRVPLPDYAVEIIKKYLPRKSNIRRKLFPYISLYRFNNNLRLIALEAGWTQIVGKTRNKRGISQEQYLSKQKQNYCFCDLISSHVMRRTAITGMLTHGVPEIVVKQVSGHSPNSKVFSRYVNFTQTHLDMELNKFHLAIH